MKVVIVTVKRLKTKLLRNSALVHLCDILHQINSKVKVESDRWKFQMKSETDLMSSCITTSCPDKH